MHKILLERQTIAALWWCLDLDLDSYRLITQYWYLIDVWVCAMRVKSYLWFSCIMNTFLKRVKCWMGGVVKLVPIRNCPWKERVCVH